MTPYILIIFLSTAGYSNSGVGGITQEFSSKATCESAGQALTVDAANKGRAVMTWGCFAK